MTPLDLEFVRAQFPAFEHPESRSWAHLENAGGSYAPHQVIERLQHFFTATKVQPYWDFGPSKTAGEAMDIAKQRLPATFNADPDEVHFGPSTTQNTYVMANALKAQMRPGDEVIVTNQDHEANIGAWRRLTDAGIVVREWGVDPESGLLSLESLQPLLTDRTTLVAVTHASNVAATINPIEEISALAREVGALVVVDGVSFAPHSDVDVRALGCDVYMYSAYKTYGPHVGMMYVERSLAQELENQGHYFNADNLTAKLVPAGPDHAEIAASAGILSYYDSVYRHHLAGSPDNDVELVRAVFALFGAHEQELMTPLVDYVVGHDDLVLVGTHSADRAHRAPTIAFYSPRIASVEIYNGLVASQISCGHGNFYARRLVEAMGLDAEDGVVRLSMVHYNTLDEVTRAIETLDSIVARA
ncbi:MAG: aminotransferase class V-fold PLP-dependent enzyme [Acidimicrobiales bacterium]